MVVVSTCQAATAAVFRAVILGAPASGKGTVSSRIVRQFDITHISSGDKLRYHVVAGTDLGKEVKRYMDSGSFVPDDTMISLISKEIEAVGNQNWLLDGFPRTLAQAEQLQKLHPINLVLNLVVPTSVILDRVTNRWTHLPSGRVYNIGFNDPRVPRSAPYRSAPGEVFLGNFSSGYLYYRAPFFFNLGPLTETEGVRRAIIGAARREISEKYFSWSGTICTTSVSRSQGKDDVTGEALCQREDDKPKVVLKRLQDYATKTESVLRYYRDIGVLKEFHGNTTDEMWPAIKNCIAQYF